ncbi:mechanosensitive ion channel family protein [Gemmata algarum]|uniref:mechanosensitive ion channel family protein n=1 Tax=Gemmata algarum TaxID=2975278 RepID=UPI002A762EB4|nr:mechanosensitive ion channel domain-containing protein [Gemmata algarum]
MWDQATHWLSDASNGWLGGPSCLGVSAGRWVLLALFAATGWVIGWLAGWPARAGLVRLRRRVPSATWAPDVEDRLTAPLALLAAAATVRAGVEVLGIADVAGGSGVRAACNVTLIAVSTLLAVRAIGVGKEYLQAALVGRAADPGRVRSITTRVTVPARILQFLVGAGGVALALLQFHAVREVGVSLLASAGVAGVVLGLAAQRTVGNILAGLQLAFAEPVRIGDTVVVESEFGIVEEINLTHVVVRVWDQHRLVLPVSYFVEKPFQNWSRGSTEVLGVVMFQADFGVPVPEIRTELNRILEGTDLWDRRVGALQVTELVGGRVELRALVSAADSSRLWDLRCYVREQLLAWLQGRADRYLPVQRVEAVGGNGHHEFAASYGPQ